MKTSVRGYKIVTKWKLYLDSRIEWRKRAKWPGALSDNNAEKGELIGFYA